MAQEFNFFSDAALTTQASFITDSFGNALDIDDFPHTDRVYLGSLGSMNLKDAGNPGVTTIKIDVIHAVPEWSEGATIAINDEVRATANNGYVYRAQGAGTTDASAGNEPAWPTSVGATVGDNGITWECVRKTIEPASVKLSADEVGLGSATGGAQLDLGVTSIAGGSINAVEVWVEIDNVATGVKVQELSIGNPDLVEEP